MANAGGDRSGALEEGPPGSSSRTASVLTGTTRRAVPMMLAAALAGAVITAGTTNAPAQTAPLPVVPDETTTTTSPDDSNDGPDHGSPTTSTTSRQAPLPERPAPPEPAPSSTTTTTTPEQQPPQEPLPPAPDHGGDGTAPPSTEGFPPDLRARMESVVRTPGNSTRALLAALAPLGDFGVEATERAIVGFGRFPVAGAATYTHDWWFPRYGPGWRLHEGTDIFAAYDTPLRAPVDGRVRLRNGGLGGVTVTIFEPSGTYWYLAHLSRIPPGLADGTDVRTGDVVGFVGTSGNAATTPPHVHIQIHPQGGPPIDPKPILDRFIDDATARVPQLIATYQAVSAAPAVEPAEPALPIPDPGAHRAAALWIASISPASGVYHLAVHAAERAAASIDWDRRETLISTTHRVVVRARHWLLPLLPATLAHVLRWSPPASVGV